MMTSWRQSDDVIIKFEQIQRLCFFGFYFKQVIACYKLVLTHYKPLVSFIVHCQGA